MRELSQFAVKNLDSTEQNMSHDKQQLAIFKADRYLLTHRNGWGKVRKIQCLYALQWLLIPFSQTHIFQEN